MTRRREFADPAPGVTKVRLSGDTVAADGLVAILRAHPAVEILAGPDRYAGGRQYILVRVRMDGGLSQDRDDSGPSLPDCARCGHPAASHDADGCGECDCPGWRSAAGMAMDAPRAAPLAAPCDTYRAAEPYGPCATCGRTREAHRLAAAAASAPWTGDDNDGGNP